MNIKCFFRKLFSVRYTLSRSQSDLWWCDKREIWTTLDDNIDMLSSTTSMVSKRKLKKYIKQIPLTEDIYIWKYTWVFFKRTIIETEYKGVKGVTEREICEQIIKNGGCEDRICENCRLDELFGDSCNTYTSLQLAKEHLAKLDKEE